MYCPKCGKENTDTAMFCSTCGNRLSAQASIVQEPVGNLPHSNTELKKTSVVLLIFLTIITFGIYYPAWFLRRRNAINNLQSKEKLGSGVFVFAIVVLSISSFVTLLSGATVPPIPTLSEFGVPTESTIHSPTRVVPHSPSKTPFYTNIDPETGQNYPNRMWSSNEPLPPDYHGKPHTYSAPPIQTAPPIATTPIAYHPGESAPDYSPDYASKEPGGKQYYRPGEGAPYYSPDYTPKKTDLSKFSDAELDTLLSFYDTPTSVVSGSPKLSKEEDSVLGNIVKALFNILINFVIYLSIPVAIRYLILRRPIQNRWIAIGILVPLFIGFATLVNIQREEGQRKIDEQAGIPHRSSSHMFGSLSLNTAMVLSYYILRRRNKTEMPNASPTMSADNRPKRPDVCPKCKAEVSADAVYCHKCGNNIREGNKA